MTCIPFCGQTRTGIPSLPRSWQHFYLETSRPSWTPDPRKGSSQGRPYHCFVSHCNRTIRWWRQRRQEDSCRSPDGEVGPPRMSCNVHPTYELSCAPHLWRSVASVYELCEQGYEVAKMSHGGLIRRPDGIPVRLTVSPADVWHVDLRQLFSDLLHMVARADAYAVAPTSPPDEMPDPLSLVDTPLTCALGHTRPDCEDLKLLHRRTGYTSHNILREEVRNGLVTGVQVNRKHFGTRAKIKRILCDTCARPRPPGPRSHARGSGWRMAYLDCVAARIY